MKKILPAVVAVAVILGWAGSSDAQHRDEPRTPFAQGLSMRLGDGHQHHRHRVVAIVVFVPAFAALGYVPYYYTTDYPYSSPAYVEQDPPADAYQEPSGFFYYCANPPGYYPQLQDCPIGWSLVAP